MIAIGAAEAGSAAAGTPRLSVEPALAERAVWRAIQAGRLGGDLSAHRRAVEVAYGLSDPQERNRAFGRAAVGEFAALGLAAPLVAAARERPEFGERLAVLAIGEARGRADEGVTCESGAAHLGIRLEAARFDDPAALLAWARHNLGHASDTLDPDFHYERDWQEPGRISAAIQARVHRLWDIGVDTRLVNEGRLERAAARDRHLSVLAADLRGLRPGTVEAVLDWLYAEPRPSFPELLAFAVRPVDLVRMAVPGEPAPPRPDLCPLCRFPDQDVQIPTPAIAALVRDDYPAWAPDDGLCARCADRYRFMSRPGGGR